LRSVKGIILAVLTLIGAFITSLICVRIEQALRDKVGAADTAQFAEIRKTAIENITGDAGFASYMANVPLSLQFFLQSTIWLGPLLIALLGFDTMSSELQHRSVRFWAIRTRRWSYFAGKMLGLWVTVALMTLVINIVAGTVVAAKGYVTAGQLLTWGVRFWFVAVLIAGTWAALATFISSCFKTPLLSLLTTFLTFFIMWVISLVGLFSRASDALTSGVAKDMNWYEYLYPNTYDTLLLSPETGKVLMALGILIGFIVVANGAGAVLFQRRDI
jgi:ABC-type transport system involved in multi-copper enzyme maturation permease subunit